MSEPRAAKVAPWLGSAGRANLGSVAKALGWLLAMLSLIGVFLGGAGLFILVIGHRTSYAFMLMAAGVVSTVYLIWFLRMGPARMPPSPAIAGGSQRRVHTPAIDAPLNAHLDEARCAGCGMRDTASNRLVPTRSTIMCERCLSEAIVRVSADWITLRPTDTDLLGRR